MRYQQRGMTLTELVVYMALAVLATVLLWALQKVTMTARNATTSNYLVNGQTETCVDWIRQDINETALTSVLVYPQPSVPEEDPGMSLVSNRSLADSKLLSNSWGAPQWDKHVAYTLEVEPGKGVGQLVRWERELSLKNMLPQPADFLPSVKGQDTSKVLLRDVMAPNSTVEGIGPGGSVQTDEHGGFRAQFVRRVGGSGGEEILTWQNPVAGNPRDNTRMMEFQLKILQDGKNYYDLTFRAAARH